MNRHRDNFTPLAFVTRSHSIHRILTFCQPIPGILISLIPMLHGCESLHQDGSFTGTSVQAQTVKLAVLNNPSDAVETLEILAFNDDNLQRLDCYQRFESPLSDKVDISSQNGEKIIMACANSHFDRNDWMHISSLTGLEDIRSELENEVRGKPVMSGSMRTEAGSSGESIILERLHSEVILRSISCDFTGRAYEGEQIKNARAYLTNVNATCPIWGECRYAERYVNRGMLSENDIRRFKDESLIINDLGTIGKDMMHCNINMICYPNQPDSEGPGTSFTRLVIEGQIAGQTWFWPIDINRGEGIAQEGVGRNMEYIYDIRITRKGSADPDTAIETGCVEFIMEVNEWKEKGEYEEVF